MNGRALNAENDVFLSGTKIAIVDGAAEVLQHVRTRLLFYKGEWFLDNNAGTPWHQSIFKKPVSLSDIESILKNRILTTPGVDELLEFSMNYDGNSNRVLSVYFSAATTYGTIDNEKVFING